MEHNPIKKPRVLTYNCTAYGGGANVVFGIANVCKANGIENKVCIRGSKVINSQYDYENIGNKFVNRINSKLGTIIGVDYEIIKTCTKSLIKQINKYKPDILHLHGIHHWSIDYKYLFKKLSKTNIKIVWTQHDCIAFTGGCPYFEMVQCDKWRNECCDCPQLKRYPASNYFDNTKFILNRKREAYSYIRNMSVVSVSKWLNNMARESCLGKFSHYTIYNGVDTDLFKPTVSDLRVRYAIEDKKIILCCASEWSENKGYSKVIELSENIDITKYIIVVIGVNEAQKKILENKHCIAIKRTYDINELIEWYSVADVFYNTSLEETFGLVTVEAMACGTPTIGYNATAYPEICIPETGICLDKNAKIQDVLLAIEKIINSDIDYSTNCRERACKEYNKNLQYDKYIDLFERIMYE